MAKITPDDDAAGANADEQTAGGESWKDDISGNSKKDRRAKKKKGKDDSSPIDEASPAPQKPEEQPPPSVDKSDKDMKGLIYQGGDLGVQPQPPPISYTIGPKQPAAPQGEPTSEEDKPAVGLYEEPAEKPPEEGEAKLEESDAIKNTFIEVSEKEGRSRAILIAIVAIALIAIVAYILISSRTPVKTTTTTIRPKGSTTIAQANSVASLNTTFINNMDISYIYTGPTTVGNTNCGVYTHSTVNNYNILLNASAQFERSITTYSANCNLTVVNISVQTPGFRIVSIIPPFPHTIPAGGSSWYNLITFQAPSANFTGPLTLVIREK
jgi:hypothetical protein